jgi:phosphoserine phosphatase
MSSDPTSPDPLPSWNEGPTKSALREFLTASAEVPVDDRVAVFDNDGTLWCEKPNYVQLEFMLSELARAVQNDPSMAAREEYRALIEHDSAAQAELGLERIALALVELCAGIGPSEFDDRVRAFFSSATHRDRAVPYRSMRYAPMLELLDALRALEFDVFVVSGGGTEFVRAVGADFYGVSPDDVVGTLVTYEFTRGDDGSPRLVRGAALDGVAANEGEVKVSNIQRHLGRRPILAAGNTAGDSEMLEYALASDGPTLALLVDHDDADREYAYAAQAGTIDFDGDLVQHGRDLGWTIASIRHDWATVFSS